MNDLAAFRQLGLSETTLAALRAKNFETPSPIQALAIPLLLDGKLDVIGQAHTGTGKTAAFGIPIVETIVRGDGAPQALILTPTRELSLQVAEELKSLADGRELRVAPFYGGQSIELQLRILRGGIDVAVGTPGRVIDLAERGKLDLSRLTFLVLDEADEMLNMGFLEDIERIMAFTNPDKRTLMFSATMPPEIRDIAARFLRQYEHLAIEKNESEAGLTEQVYYEVTRASKIDALSRLIDLAEEMYAIVFCRTRSDVDELAEKLRARGYEVEALHGDIPQAQRTKVINRFKRHDFPILIATDVAARGIDVNDLTHVINYSMPQGDESYVHRIGRTGRAGKTGMAVTFVTPAESRRLSSLQKLTPNRIRRETIPEVADIVNAKKRRYLKKLGRLAAAGEHEELFDFAEELLASFADPVAAAAAMLKLHFTDELLETSYAKLSTNAERRDSEEERRARNQVRLFVDAGKRDGFTPVKLLELIFQRTGLRSYKLGKVECRADHAYVHASLADAKKIVAAFSRKEGPRIELAEEAPPPPARRAPARPPKAPPAKEQKRARLRDLVKDFDPPRKPDPKKRKKAPKK